MEGKIQTVRSIERTCHHRCCTHSFDQGAQRQQGLYWLESQPSICEERSRCRVFFPGQLTLASAFAGAAKCYGITHPKQVKFNSSSNVKDLVVGRGVLNEGKAFVYSETFFFIAV